MDLTTETVELLSRAERAQKEARRLLELNADWQACVHEHLNDIFRIEVEFRRKMGRTPFPKGWGQTEISN
ncbi:MAG: hypothetical protein JOZ16_10780 [Methylobacteriaceae bacterium]|nr:hypothetical protein [Methylobacteriaceae bacterium]